MKKSIILKSLGLGQKKSTTSLLKRTMQVTAFTFSCLVALPSFVQTADASCYLFGCYDDDGIFHLYPTPGIPHDPPDDPPWDPWGDPDPNPPTCDYLGDPDCDDDDGGGGGGGGDPDPDPDYLACVDHYAMKDEECLFRPVGGMGQDWSQFGTNFSALFSPYWGFGGLPGGGILDFGAPLQVYQNIIRDVARAYWNDQSLSAVNEAYWAGVDVYCIGFPEETIVGADRSDCYDDAYSVSLRLIPSFSSNAFTISQVERYGVTIRHLSSGNPFANWAADFFTDINNVKECKLWFDARDQIPGCN